MAKVREKLSDAEHAKVIRQAIEALEARISNAASDGVKVKLEIGLGTGFERDADVMTRFPTVRAEIVRPL